MRAVAVSPECVTHSRMVKGAIAAARAKSRRWCELVPSSTNDARASVAPCSAQECANALVRLVPRSGLE